MKNKLKALLAFILAAGVGLSALYGCAVTEEEEHISDEEEIVDSDEAGGESAGSPESGNPSDSEQPAGSGENTPGGNEPSDSDKPTVPENPTEPEDPTKPEDPTEPEEPTKPEDPTEPEDPTKPEEPTKPEDPAKPEDPTEPEKPTDPEKPSGGGGDQGEGTDTPPENEDDEDDNAPFVGIAGFEDIAFGTEIGKSAVSSNGVSFYYNQNSGAECKIVKHPKGEGYALRFAKNDVTKGDTVAFNVRNEGDMRFVAEFDLAFERSNNTAVPLQINLGSAYRIQISIDGNYVLVNDAKANGSATYFLGGYVKMGDFIHIRVEYYYGDGTLDGQFAKIYFDGELFAISQNCYSSTPSANYSLLKFYSLIASDAAFYIDNVEAYSDNVTFVDDGDSTTAYYYADESRDSAYNNRFLPARAVLGEDAASALEKLCAIFDEGTYTWLANLYDPETGAFYYSNDARDYAGFLPDIESTAQAMGLLNSMGLGTAQKEYTPEMAAKIVAWVQSLQSNDDGYFYHPQWGTDINSSRRGRDLGNSIGVLNRFKAQPLYPTALDRLSGNVGASKNLTSPLGASSVEAVSYVVFAATTSVNAHLASPEAFLEYLDGLFEKNITTDSNGNRVPNSYVIGHTVGSQSSQIKAAGLADVCINYFNERQNPENGLWENEENYRTASGLLKISSFYNSLGAEFPNPDKAVRSAINISASEETMDAIVYVYNPLSALSNILSNLKNYSKSEGSAELRLATIEEMQGRAVELIENTEKKLLLFKKADGSFSYNTYGAPANSQGAPVCFGANEGDVNGSALANGTIVALYASLGLTKPIYYNSADKCAFWDIIYNKAAVEKKSVDRVEVDFEQTAGTPSLPRFTTASLSSTGSYEITKLPIYGKESNVLKLSSFNGYNDSLRIALPKNYADTEVNSYVLEADIMISPKAENTSQHLMQVRLDAAYMLVFEIKNKKLHLYDSTSTGAGNVTGDLGIYTDLDDWFKLRVEYYPAGKSGTLIFVYINGDLAAVSTNYYGPRVNGEIPEPSYTVSSAAFMTLNAADVDFYIDNAVLEKSDKTASFPERIYDFESSDRLPAGVSVNGGSGNCTAEVKRDGDNSYLETKSVNGYGHNVVFASTPALGDTASYVFAADLKYVSANNTTVTQIFLGNSGSTAFGLDVMYKDGSISITTRTAKGQGSKIIQGIDASKTFRLEVVYNPSSGCAKITVTHEGDPVGASVETDAFYSETTKSTHFDTVRIYSLLGAVYTLNIDNVEVYDVKEG